MTIFAGPLPRQFAHRGASGTCPENTLEAFRAAREMGAHAFELDIHGTADGEIVVVHDPTLDRTTDGTGLVRERTLEELRTFDAGYRFSPDAGRTFPFRGSGITIPTLGDVFEAFPDTPVIVEIKQAYPPIEDALARLLHSRKAESRALVFSLEQGPLDRYRAGGSERPTGFGPDDVAEFLRRVNSGAWDGYGPPGIVLAVPVRWRGTQIVSAPFVTAAHRHRCEVFVWTVNDPREMHILLDLGVDGIISDFPDRLSRVVTERATSR